MQQKLEFINDVPQCDIGAPMPTILSDEFNIYLFYYLKFIDPKWDGTYVHIRNTNDTGIACITFEFYRQFKFGSPNDEAIKGHPLFKLGLRPYSFLKVLNSEWIKELIKMNKVHPKHKDEYFKDCKHFIYFFHDSCFEVVCDSYKFEVSVNKSIKQAINEKIDCLKI